MLGSPPRISSPELGTVRISLPASVTTIVCSNWADQEPSLVSTVQPSSHCVVRGLPKVSIGSTVNVMPGTMMVSFIGSS